MGNSFPILATEGHFLPGRSTQQNCCVIRWVLRVDIRYYEGKENRPVGSVRQRKGGHYTSAYQKGIMTGCTRGGRKKGCTT